VQLNALGSWPATVDEAVAMQDALRPLVDTTGPRARAGEIRTGAGLDVASVEGDDRVAAAAVIVLDAASLRPVELHTTSRRPWRDRFRTATAGPPDS
jgi:deoxyribonuclease V